jgi:hypothetical protein
MTRWLPTVPVGDLYDLSEYGIPTECRPGIKKVMQAVINSPEIPRLYMTTDTSRASLLVCIGWVLTSDKWGLVAKTLDLFLTTFFYQFRNGRIFFIHLNRSRTASRPMASLCTHALKGLPKKSQVIFVHVVFKILIAQVKIQLGCVVQWSYFYIFMKAFRELFIKLIKRNVFYFTAT